MHRKSKIRSDKNKVSYSAVRPYKPEKVSKESIYRICTANSSSANISIDKIINGSEFKL